MALIFLAAGVFWIAKPLAVHALKKANRIAENNGFQTSCTNKATFVKDVTIPDGTVFEPGESFRKTWRYRNSGTCTWDKDYKFVFYSGDRMGSKFVTYLPKTVTPGKTVDVSVNLIAPAEPDDYRSRWKFQTPGGTVMSRPYVDIVVEAPDVLASLKDEVYFFVGGGGGDYCENRPQNPSRLAVGNILPEPGLFFQSTEVCLYGFPLHKKITLVTFTPEGRYTVSFTPGKIGSKFNIYDRNGNRTGRTGSVVEFLPDHKGVPVLALFLFTPPYAPDGWWGIRATSSSLQAETSFKMPAPEPYVMVQHTEPYYPFSPLWYSGRDCYSTGDRIRLVGGGFDPREMVPLGIYYNSGEDDDLLDTHPLIYKTAVKADNEGEFVLTVRVEASDPPGYYVPATPDMYGGGDENIILPLGFCVD